MEITYKKGIRFLETILHLFTCISVVGGNNPKHNVRFENISYKDPTLGDKTKSSKHNIAKKGKIRK